MRASASRSERAGSAPSTHICSCIGSSSKEAAKARWAATANKPLNWQIHTAATERRSSAGADLALARRRQRISEAASSLHRPNL